MTIEEALQALLANDTDVQALVGTRIFPDQSPESSAYPRIIYSQAERLPIMTYGGPITSNKYTMSLEIHARNKASAKAVAAAVRDLLNGYTGAPSGVTVFGIFSVSESDAHELPQHGEERGIFGVDFELDVWFRQPT